VSLQFKLITTQPEFDGLADEWNILLPTNATNVPFLSWQWISTWWAAYQPGALWVFTARDAAGKLAGVAPCFIETESNVLREIGCVDVTDYLDLIVASEHREAFCEGLAACLTENKNTFSRLNLCNVPQGTPTFETLTAALEKHGFTVEVAPQEVCPLIALPETFEAYLDALPKKQRHELRRKIRRADNLEGDADEVAWHIVGENDDLAAAITQFTDLMAASTPEKAAFLQNPKHVAFFTAIVPKMAACGWLQLAFLTLNGAPVAAYLNLVYDGRVLVYNSGLSMSHGYLSPGIVLLAKLIEHAIQNGHKVFDFLRGNEEYKYRMGGVDHPVLEIKARLA
jgi:CelD/BcsL family acetyltransferase involved in cellulose biosynthesis